MANEQIIAGLTDDLNIIQKLDDEPNDVGGLTSAQLKAKFDESGNLIQKYINETLVPAIRAADSTAAQGVNDASAAQSAAQVAQNTAEDAQSAAYNAGSMASSAYSLAAEAKNAAEEAQNTASSAWNKASAVQSAVEVAQNTAEDAQSAASNAGSMASSAYSLASEAKNAAEDAQSTASSAWNKASAAQSAAEDAQSTAEDARDTADAAQSTASDARSLATTAQSTAENALAAANNASNEAQYAQVGVTDLEGRAVLKTGGVMTGALTLSADPTGNMQAATKQYVDNAVQGAGGGGVSSWNDLTDKPFYEEGETVEVLAEQTIGTFETEEGMSVWLLEAEAPAGTYPTAFTIGETYKILWDESEWECTATDFNGIGAVGNGALVGVGEDTGEPFYIVVYPSSVTGEETDALLAFTTDEGESHRIAIYQNTTVIKPVDKKYLPVAAAVDLTAYESDGVIVETYPDGSTVTYTVTFDDSGNPVSITDSVGNTTTLTW